MQSKVNEFWGDHGRCWLSFDDCDTLLGLDGEAGAPVEIKQK